MKSYFLLATSFFLLTNYCVSQTTTLAEPSYVKLGDNYYAAGIATEEFDFFAAPNEDGTQRQSNWCWAACAQMVLNYYDIMVTQEELVKKVYGNLIDKPANFNQICSAISGWSLNSEHGQYSLACDNNIQSADDITLPLLLKAPLIVGLKGAPNSTEIGHAYVLTGIYYSVDGSNRTIPDKLVLRDPWPTNPSLIEMNWKDFESRVFAVTKIWTVH